MFFCFLPDPDFGFLYFFGVFICGVVIAYLSIGVRAMVSVPTRTIWPGGSAAHTHADAHLQLVQADRAF